MPTPDAPPSDLSDALGGDADKQAWVNWLFSRVAERYDLGNDLMSAGWHTRWKRRLVDLADIWPNHAVLDIACGTGDVTYLVAARAHAGKVVGTDVNAAMLAVAERKRPPNTAHVSFVEADATRLPFPDATFDRVTIGYAGRGFSDLVGVVRESYRVLKPGGIFWNLDFARPPQPWWDRTYRGYMTVSGAVLGLALHGDPLTYTYIPASMASYRGQRWLEEEMRAIGFRTRTLETFGCLMAFNQGIKPGVAAPGPTEAA